MQFRRDFVSFHDRERNMVTRQHTVDQVSVETVGFAGSEKVEGGSVMATVFYDIRCIPSITIKMEEQLMEKIMPTYWTG